MGRRSAISLLLIHLLDVLLPDVCYNFLYRPPRTGIELIMRYFVGTELGVANLLQRHFDWASNALWYEDIPNARDPAKSFFLVGGKDDIINAVVRLFASWLATTTPTPCYAQQNSGTDILVQQRVKKYLTSHGVRKGLWYDPNGRHGQALMRGGAGHAAVLKWLRA